MFGDNLVEINQFVQELLNRQCVTDETRRDETRRDETRHDKTASWPDGQKDRWTDRQTDAADDNTTMAGHIRPVGY